MKILKRIRNVTQRSTQHFNIIRYENTEAEQKCLPAGDSTFQHSQNSKYGNRVNLTNLIRLNIRPTSKMGPAEAENSSKLPKKFGKNIRFSITKSPFFFLKII